MLSKVEAAAGDTPMDVNISGKHVAVGEALRSRIEDELAARVGKYFDRGGEADVVVHREGHQFGVDLVIRLASGQRMVAKGMGGDAHSAFDVALTKLETRIRRYKRKLVSHKPHHGGPGSRAELAAYTVLRAPDDADELDDAADEWGSDGSAGSGPPAGAVIAESQAEVRAMTVSMAVMELDLTGAPVVMFRNVAHDGLSVVYRRPDGNIGWIDPQRTAGAAAPRARPNRRPTFGGVTSMDMQAWLADGAIATGVAGGNKRQALAAIADLASRAYGLETTQVLDALVERESQGSTGVGHGVAVPHAQLPGLTGLRAVFVRLDAATPFGAVDDRPVDLLFALFAPVGAGSEHLRALARASRMLRRPETREALRQARSSDAVRALLVEERRSSAA